MGGSNLDLEEYGSNTKKVETTNTVEVPSTVDSTEEKTGDA